MAKTKISEFSATPGNNTDIDGINIAEGCAPSGINDAIRELMAQLKDFQAGTAGDSFNGPVGTTTAAAGAFTTLSASSTVTLSGGTANGVPYLNGSKVLTTGSALVFDGSNLGLGVTPSAWSSLVKGLQMSGGSNYTNGSNYGMLQNAYYATGGWTYVNTAAATRYDQTAGAHTWFTAPSGTAGNAITFTQAMTLSGTDRTQLLLGATSALFSTANRGLIELTGTTDSLISLNIGGTARGYIHANANGLDLLANSGYALNFYSNGTYAGKFDTSGNLLVGATSYSGTGVSISGTQGNNFWISRANTTTAYNQFIFGNPNGNVGFIQTSGSGTVYATSSDYRLKEQVQPMTGALAKVTALKPCTYKWKADGSAGEGFIAHELQAVVPQCVTGEKDAVDEDGKPVYQGIDTSFLVATLTAALQELNAKVEAQAAEIAALKGN